MKNIKLYIEDNPVIWNVSIYGADRYSEDLGYFKTQTEAEAQATVELIKCKKSEHIYGANAYVRGFNLERAEQDINERKRDITHLQNEIDQINNIIGD